MFCQNHQQVLLQGGAGHPRCRVTFWGGDSVLRRNQFSGVSEFWRYNHSNYPYCQNLLPPIKGHIASFYPRRCNFLHPAEVWENIYWEKSSEEEWNHICQIIQGISFLVLIGWLLRMKYAVFSVLGFFLVKTFLKTISQRVFLFNGVWCEGQDACLPWRCLLVWRRPLRHSGLLLITRGHGMPLPHRCVSRN